MQDANDIELLRNFSRDGSEDAFAELVRRHINLVFSCAIRHVVNAAHAEEVTQAVFVILAQKAARLRPNTILEGWLYETTRLTSLSFLRGERRRQFREQEAYMRSTLSEPATNSAWEQLAPLLDEAMAQLGKTDRDAVVMRFFNDKSFREIAVALKINERAAQKRGLRALEKLRRFFGKRGVALTATVIAGAVSANSVQAAPIALATSISAAAITKGAVATGATLTLVKSTLKMLAWTKAKMVLALGAGALLLAGTATLLVKQQHQDSGAEHYIRNITSIVFHEIPPYFVVRPTRYNFSPRGTTAIGTSSRALGRNMPMLSMIQYAYYFHNQTRTVLPPEGFSSGGFDFLVTIPDGMKKFQEEIKNQFGYEARKEIRNVDALVLRVRIPNATGLKANEQYSQNDRFFIDWSGLPISYLIDQIEVNLEIPVVDQTGLKGEYAVQLDWEESSGAESKAKLRQAILDQLGLELVPTNMPIEIFVVERVKKSSLILPGVSVGNLKAGMTRDQIVVELGEPDRMQGNMMVYDKKFGMSVGVGKTGLAIVLCGDSSPTNPGVKRFNGRTKEGIGMNSSRAEVIMALGQPTTARPWAPKQEELVYDSLGLTFLLENGKVFHMTVDFRKSLAP